MCLGCLTPVGACELLFVGLRFGVLISCGWVGGVVSVVLVCICWVLVWVGFVLNLGLRTGWYNCGCLIVLFINLT